MRGKLLKNALIKSEHCWSLLLSYSFFSSAPFSMGQQRFNGIAIAPYTSSTETSLSESHLIFRLLKCFPQRMSLTRIKHFAPE